MSIRGAELISGQRLIRGKACAGKNRNPLLLAMLSPLALIEEYSDLFHAKEWVAATSSPWDGANGAR